ncbi:MAG TPA: glycosyltransferase [Clostridia bacterium]|mgnify:CR=1 FL=1|nr:glycosyltransferase [Clostridia bacterium]
MITAIVTLLTFLSTFFAMLHFICSFRYRQDPERKPARNLGFSLIIPCYNEAPIIHNTIRGILNLEYSHYEAIFVNDGSTDETLRILFEALQLEPYARPGFAHIPGARGIYRSKKHPRIFVIDKQNSGKASSLNMGIRFCSKELVVTLDGDSVLEKNALNIMNCSFQDKDMIASGGAVHVMQYFLMEARKKPLIAIQALDFIKGFYIYKPSLCVNNALSIISGAFGVFRKDALKAIGGFMDGLGEDIDITIRLQEYAQRKNKSISYNMDAICYTECPETWRDLKRQRVRWQKAFLDAIMNNRRFLVRQIFKTPVCFFMLMDAAFSGSMAVLTFFVNYILISLRLIYGMPELFLLFAALAVLFNILNSVVAVRRAVRRGPQTFRAEEAARAGRRRTKTGSLYLITWMDLTLFSFLRITFFVRGTVSYFLKRRSWDKLKRTSNAYML